VQQAKAANATDRKTALPLNLIKLPPGFKIEIYADNLTYARSMALSPNETLFLMARAVHSRRLTHSMAQLFMPL
jgi:hypothetical protein